MKAVLIGDQIVITMSVDEAVIASIALTEGGDPVKGAALESVFMPGGSSATVLGESILVPDPVTFDPSGGISCQVDPLCTWTGKSLSRAQRHGSRSSLQDAGGGHLPKLIKG